MRPKQSTWSVSLLFFFLRIKECPLKDILYILPSFQFSLAIHSYIIRVQCSGIEPPSNFDDFLSSPLVPGARMLSSLFPVCRTTTIVMVKSLKKYRLSSKLRGDWAKHRYSIMLAATYSLLSRSPMSNGGVLASRESRLHAIQYHSFIIPGPICYCGKVLGENYA